MSKDYYADFKKNARAMKLVEHEVREIRLLHLEADVSLDEIAEKYNIAKTTVIRIVTRQTWKGVL